jgi:nitrogen fixation protein NifZ
MTNIVRDSNDASELTNPPYFAFGEKVKAKRVIRNDGTYAGKEIGEVLAKKGEIGYITSIGTFLQQFYIYGVEFTESGNRVGMKRKELEPVVPRPGDDDELPLPGPTLSERAGGIA